MDYNFHKNLTLDILTTQFIINGEIVWRTEEWRNILGYEGRYHVSSFGRVKSLERTVYKSNKSIQPFKERIRKPYFNSGGYCIVNLWKEGKGKTFKTSILVAMAFLDHKPDGHKVIVDHKDNIKTHDYLSNLQLISSRENNSKDRFRVNYTSKHVGVNWHKASKKWVAQIQTNKKKEHLGLFNTEEEALISYQKALRSLT